MRMLRLSAVTRGERKMKKTYCIKKTIGDAARWALRQLSLATDF